MPTKKDLAVTKATNSKALVLSEFGFTEMKDTDVKREAKGRGSENVLAGDKLIPRLAIAQDGSPEVKKREPNYIEGIEAGHLFNTVTRENYGERVAFVPVFFRTQYINWRKKNAGGGFLGQFDVSQKEDAIGSLPKQAAAAGFKLEDCETVETYENYGFILNGEGGQPEFVSVSMPKTKQRPARRLNSLVEFYGGDRWKHAYWLGTISETSKVTGDDYFNYAVEFAGACTPATVALAEHFYQQMLTVSVKTDYTNNDKAKGDSTEY